MAKILLDTTYLLPVFGVGIRLEEFSELFPRLLERHEVLYSPLSLVEAKWVILSLARRDPGRKGAYLSAYRLGLKALLADGRLKQTQLTSPAIEEIADALLEAGLRDYFDRMIYATAAVTDSILLTEDQELAEAAKILPWKPKEVASWSDVASGQL